MKRFPAAALLLAVSCCALAQSTSTPNLKLNLPVPGTYGWAPRINANMSRLDSFLSGGLPLPQLTVDGAITNAHTPTVGTDLTNKAYVDSILTGGSNATQIQGFNVSGTAPGANNVLVYTSGFYTPTPFDAAHVANTIDRTSTSPQAVAGPLSATALSSQLGGVSQTWTVGSGGVTANQLVNYDDAGGVVDASDPLLYAGIAASTAASGTVEVYNGGFASCVFDGEASPGDIAIPSTTNPGQCDDSGQSNPLGVPAFTALVGVIQSTVASAGDLGTVFLYPQSIFGSFNTDLAVPGLLSLGAGTGTIQFTHPGSGVLQLLNHSAADLVELRTHKVTTAEVDLAADPTTALQAATKQYVDSSTAAGVTSFHSRTGAVSPASADYTAAQVTNALDLSNTGSQTLLGSLAISTGKTLTLGGDPSSALQAATKQYVDGRSGVTAFNSRTGAISPTSGDYSFSLISGTLASSQFGPLTGDVTTTGYAATVARINGILLSGLASGLLKNATGTGVPSIATDGTDYLSPTTGVVSFNGRHGTVSPASADYTAAQVTNALDLSNAGTQTMAGSLALATIKAADGTTAMTIAPSTGFITTTGLISGGSMSSSSFKDGAGNSFMTISAGKASFPLQATFSSGLAVPVGQSVNTPIIRDNAGNAAATLSSGAFTFPQVGTFTLGAKIGTGQTMTSPPEMVAYTGGGMALATLNNLSGAPLTMISPITITRLEWQLNATATGCTTNPQVTVMVNSVASALVATVSLATFFGHQDTNVNVPAGQNVQLKVTTAEAGCTPTTSTLQAQVHYVMQ